MLVYVFADKIGELITSVLGISSAVFVVDALIALATVGIVASIAIFIIVSRQTKKELLEALHCFLEHWKEYEKLIQRQSLKPPENKGIMLCSDKIKSAVAETHELNVGRAIFPQIRAISNDMAELGHDVLEQFPNDRRYRTTFGDKDALQCLINRGNIIYEKLALVISIVEQPFMWFYS